MPIDTSSTQAFTDSELLGLYREALAKIAAGQSYTINGRSLTNADLKTVREMIEWLEGRINTDDSLSPGGLGLVEYGERQ